MLVSDLPPELPLGTIISWVTKVPDFEGETVDLPAGWQRCDGSTIEHPSVWAGKLTPDLNKEKRFLRGGPDSLQLTLEEDQLQDHEHHVILTDPGHSHDYTDRYLGYHTTSNCATTGCTYDYSNNAPHSDTSFSGKTNISAEVTGVRTGNHGTETRPRNMNVIFIIRVF